MDGTSEVSTTSPPTAGRVDIEDLSLFYSEYGTGPALVWLHWSGPGASGLSNFGGNLPAFEDFRNIVFDLPRFGSSDKPTVDGPLIDHSAQCIASGLDELGIQQADFVGNSFGGGVALKLAIDHPQLVRRLVVMAPGGAMPDELAEWPEGIQLLFEYMSCPEPSRELLERFIRVMLVDQSLFTETLLDERFAASQNAHPELGVPTNFGDLKPDLHRVKAPTLVLWGREDRTVPVDWAPALLHGIADAELRVVPHCGHWVQYERRELFNRIVRDFLKEEL